MTREDFSRELIEQFKKNGIEAEAITADAYSVKAGKKEFFISLYKISVTITVYWNVKPYDSVRLMSMDIFYDDISQMFVNDNRLFIMSMGKSCSVFRMERD